MDGLVLGRWRVGPKLGDGTTGRVHLATDGERTAAVKLLAPGPAAERELALTARLAGTPGVVPVLGAGQHGGDRVLVMPLAEQSLEDRLGPSRVPPGLTEALAVLADVAAVLAAIDGVAVHRDVKPDNLLLIAGRWHLTDFGIAAPAEEPFDSGAAWLTAWTDEYAAPEVWQCAPPTAASDVYAFGVVAHQLLAGCLPFAGPAPADYRAQHLTAEPPGLPNLPPGIAALVAACLSKDPAARPSASSLRDAFAGALEAAGDPGSRPGHRQGPRRDPTTT